ncbi:MAG: hypothetical protein GY928_06470 [Colwellia sp.]|nr:hypothetical protein [Colwellia sp.]
MSLFKIATITVVSVMLLSGFINKGSNTKTTKTKTVSTMSHNKAQRLIKDFNHVCDSVTEIAKTNSKNTYIVGCNEYGYRYLIQPDNVLGGYWVKSY